MAFSTHFPESTPAESLETLIYFQKLPFTHPTALTFASARLRLLPPLLRLEPLLHKQVVLPLAFAHHNQRARPAAQLLQVCHALLGRLQAVHQDSRIERDIVRRIAHLFEQEVDHFFDLGDADVADGRGLEEDRVGDVPVEAEPAAKVLDDGFVFAEEGAVFLGDLEGLFEDGVRAADHPGHELLAADFAGTGDSFGDDGGGVLEGPQVGEDVVAVHVGDELVQVLHEAFLWDAEHEHAAGELGGHFGGFDAGSVCEVVDSIGAVGEFLVVHGADDFGHLERF
uniref:(northern house mosquito) hypothetical protein n=1 Tax=Culex pipiens TaxID=7175 RepID=A0A8D8NPT8_CULPI